jgi:calmodulin
MNTLAINASQAEIDLMIGEIDKNNDGMANHYIEIALLTTHAIYVYDIGEIQFEEFVSVMSRKVQASYTADEVKAAFKVFEGGAPQGYIKVDALEKALRVTLHYHT